MLKGVKIRLYLNVEQTHQMNSLMGSYRFVYNQCLDYKESNYKNNKKNIKFKDLGKYYHGTLRDTYPWLKDHNTKVLKSSIIDLMSAYNGYFNSNKGLPKFKCRNDKQSVRFPREAISVNTFDEEHSRINLTTTIKGLRFRCSDRDKYYLYKNKEKIRNLTITKTKSGKYFASIIIDGDILRVVPKPKNYIVGMDVGAKKLVMYDNGESVDNPRWMHSNEKQLKKLQRQMSRKEKGSKNWEKARIRFAVKHEKTKNKKQNYLNVLTTKITDENQNIVLEDLNVKGMMKNHKLAKTIQELGLYEMRRQIEYKARWKGRTVIFVDRFYPSSKLCSNCGYKKVDLTLKDREWTCPVCGEHHDRDLNAAINIKNEGLRILNEDKIRQRLPEFTLADNPTMDDKEHQHCCCSPKK